MFMYFRYYASMDTGGFLSYMYNVHVGIKLNLNNHITLIISKYVLVDNFIEL